MRTFVVRLNPDPRKGRPYSSYPSTVEYSAIHESAVMDGFHEAVNFLGEDGVIRGYLPPRHLKSMRSGEVFNLITITAKTAKVGGDLVVGFQVGCRYEGDKHRSGGTTDSKALKFNWHYSCVEANSMLLDKPVEKARELILGKGGSWVRGPTYALKSASAKRVFAEIGASLTTSEERRRFERLVRIMSEKQPSTVPETYSELQFEEEVAQALKGDLANVVGNKSPVQVEVRIYRFVRDPKVVAVALTRAKGICEDCGKSVDFISKLTGFPFLEVHHLKTLKSGGRDTVENVVAVCPNCHRKRHYA